jgi:hypothetical protein
MRTKDNPTTPVHLEAEGHVTTNPQIQSPDVVNGYELQAIENLSAWVAEEQELAPEAVRSITEASFGVRDVGAIPRNIYDDVIRFLIDLRIDDIRN